MDKLMRITMRLIFIVNLREFGVTKETHIWAYL